MKPVTSAAGASLADARFAIAELGVRKGRRCPAKSMTGHHGPAAEKTSSIKFRLLPFFCVISCLFTAASSGCARRRPPATAGPQILRISQRNEPVDLDPALVTLPDEFSIIRALSEGLVSPAPGGGQQPAAAESWDLSPDGLVYTFHLHRDARWSNGDPLVAADFVESYRRLLTPATAAPKAALFFGVKNARAFVAGQIADFAAVGIHAADDRTLVVVLAQPTPNFLAYVASGPWIPVDPRVVLRHGRDWTRPGNFVGNGPFVLADWQPGQRIAVRKNPRYRAAAGIRLDGIDFIRFDDDDTEERAYRAGQIDVTVTVPRTRIAVQARERPAELHRAPAAETRFLSFNTRRAPLGDARVRRALALAIDRKAIVERVMLGGQQPAFRFVPPPLRLAGTPSLAAELRDDPAEARQLLAAAGFPDGRNFPRLELAAWSSSQTPVLEAIQARWRQELGINIAIATREAKVLLAGLGTGDYDIDFVTTLAILDVNDPVALLDNFTTTAANNFPRWHSDEFDRLLASAAVEPDAMRQAALLAAAESLLLEAAPVAPIYFNARNWLMSSRVHGWQEDEMWNRFYAGIYLQEN